MISPKSLTFNQNSCKKPSPLEEFLQKTQIFKGVELNYESIKTELSDNFKLKELAEILQVYDHEAVSIFSLEDFSLSSDENFKSKIIPQLKEMMDFCYKLECDLITVHPSSIDLELHGSDPPKWRIIKRTTKRLQAIAKMAWEEDINIGFEMVSDAKSSIQTIENAMEVLNPLKSQENVGYIIDLFHLIKTQTDFTLLAPIKEFIFLVQICDFKNNAEQKPGELTEEDRILPGQGNYNFKQFFTSLHKIRYRKRISVEGFQCEECDATAIKEAYQVLLNF